MSWVTLNESNWREVLVPGQEVQPGTGIDNRATFVGDLLSGSIQGGQLENSVISLMAFAGPNAFTTKPVNRVKIELVSFEQEPQPSGYIWEGHEVALGDRWVDDQGVLLLPGARADMSGGIQTRIAAPAAPTWTYANTQKVPGTVVESEIPYVEGFALLEAGTGICFGAGQTPRNIVLGGSISARVSYWDDGGSPEPADPKGPFIVARRSYQFMRGTSPVFRAWARGEGGPIDLSGLELAAKVTAYRGRHVQEEWTAAAFAGGEIQFSPILATRLSAGLYQVSITIPATGELVALGLMEVV